MEFYSWYGKVENIFHILLRENHFVLSIAETYASKNSHGVSHHFTLIIQLQWYVVFVSSGIRSIATWCLVRRFPCVADFAVDDTSVQISSIRTVHTALERTPWGLLNNSYFFIIYDMAALYLHGSVWYDIISPLAPLRVLFISLVG